MKRLIMGLKTNQSLTSSTLTWALRNLAGRLPDEEIVDNIIGNEITSISSLEIHLNELFGEVYWNSSIKISSDDDRFPEKISFTIIGNNQEMNRFMAAVVAVFTSNKYNLVITNIVILNGSFITNMKKGEKEEIKRSTSEIFGFMDNAFSELYKKPDFWNMIFSLYAIMNYELTIIPKQLFEELLGGKTLHAITTIIERFYGCPINQISLDDLLIKIKEIYQYTGVIENIDIDKDSLIIHHTFSDPEAIKKLAGIFIELLRLGGHSYNSVTSRNLIILKHIPKEGKLLIKMINELRTTGESTRNYSEELLKMFDMLRNMPFNEEILKSLGHEFGETMIQNYEKEKRIDVWNAQTFIKYVKETSIILKHDSKIEIIGKNIIYAKIVTCPIVRDDAKFNNSNCIFIKGIFNGWISYAFGEHIEITHTIVQKPVSRNGYCEVFFNIDGTR